MEIGILRVYNRLIFCFKTDPPDSITISQFMNDDSFGRVPLKDARNPFTCGISGKTYTALEARDRAALLARALSKELGIKANNGSEWDKVVGIFSFNTVGSASFSLPGSFCRS